MARLAAFLRQPPIDRRLLAAAAILHVTVAALVRVLPFGRVCRFLDRTAVLGRRDEARADADVDARVIRAVQIVSAALPGATCLTEALAAGFLLRRLGCETTLSFGVSRDAATDRPFDAHAWLERDGATILGGRALAYDPLASPSRCAPSPSPR